MLSFWAGGISSFSPCAREYRLLRRLKYLESLANRAIACMQYQTVNKICGSCPLPAQAFSVGRQEGEHGGRVSPISFFRLSQIRLKIDRGGCVVNFNVPVT